MADYNRNRQDAYRQQFDWNEDYHRQPDMDEDEPNYTISENRGYRDSGRRGSMSSGEGGWQSRYERQMNTGRESDFDSGQQRPSGRYRESDYGYGPGQRGLSSAYSDFGGDYSARSSRNLYDRGNLGINRRDYENTENRLGGSNYGRYGDRGRYDPGKNQRDQGGFSRSDYRRPDYRGYDYSERDWNRSDYRNRDYGRGDSEERSWWDRTTDEVSSWFGDEDAEQRRERDRMQSHRGRGPKNYTRSDDRIREDINDRLSDDPFVDASDIEVTVNSGDVKLSGTVDHRSSKRRAEDLADSVSGVKNVENHLRVGQISGSEGTSVSGINNPSGMASTSSSPIPGSERGKTRETSKNT